MKTPSPAKRTRPAIALLVILLMLAVSLPPAGASSWGARKTADVLFIGLRALGWEVRDHFTSGLLRRGESKVYPIILYEGNAYTIAASGCEDSYDVDIALYDEDGNFIDSDDDSTNLAVVEVAPRWTGVFYVKVTMFDSTRDGAHYVVQYAFR